MTVSDIVRDITRDPLTGLANRREFERQSRAAFLSAQSDNRRHALCYLDLDGFKAVNDACGHDAGDHMLVGVAARVRDTVGDAGVVARVGGDEFAILLKDCSLEEARRIAGSIVRDVADYRVTWNDKSLSVGVSIGLVELSRESGSWGEEMFAADVACSLAKEQADHVRAYSAGECAEFHRRDEMHRLNRLQAVLNFGPPELETRPLGLADAQSSDTPGREVVLRLKDENGATVAWRELLSAAETYRLIPLVDRWVVKNALTAFGCGEVDLPAGRRLLIRLSGQSLGEEDFLQFVLDCFEQTGVTPDRVCFELTEESVISNADAAHLFIGVLHGMGCRFGLGGVGRAPPSFDRLSKRRFGYLRFDGDLIRSIGSDSEQRARVTTMIERARLLGFQVVAEKVDDPGAANDVVAIEIEWQIESEKVLDLMVHADGSIHRHGDGTPLGVSCYLHTGRSEESLLRNVLEGTDPELLGTGGVMVLEPIIGKLCKLFVSFGRKDGGGNALEVWYGSASAGPHPAIMAFVRNAIEQTDDWYRQLRTNRPGD
jgi:diguanylate cyclase (GGDEF)-like protein